MTIVGTYVQCIGTSIFKFLHELQVDEECNQWKTVLWTLTGFGWNRNFLAWSDPKIVVRSGTGTETGTDLSDVINCIFHTNFIRKVN